MTYDPNHIEDGVYTDMPIEIYHQNTTHLSASSIKEAFKSNAHFKAYLDRPKERKSYFDFGNAFELSITNHNDFKNKVAIYDESERPEKDKNFGSKLNKAWKEEFYSKNKDKLIIPVNGDNSLDTLTILKGSLYQHKAATSLLVNSEYQTTIFWTCPHTGLKLKTRPDFWKPETSDRTAIVADLKTDANSEKDKHLKKIYDLNYPIQSVLQLMGLRHVKLVDLSARFFWIICSKTVPFNTEVYEFDSSDIEIFTEALIFKLEDIKRAIDKGEFLSYEPTNCMGIKTVDFPIWYKKKLGIVEHIDN